MRFGFIHRFVVFMAALLLAVAAGNAGQAQTATGTLRGQVTDPSGAAVTSATVLVTTPSGAATTATTNRDGIFEVTGLAPGKYGVKVIAPGFTTYENLGIDIVAGQAQKLNVSMSIEVQEEKVEVTDTTTKVDVNPANNAGAIVMQGKDLEALSDDPDELQSELQALAGPSAGPNGGQIYIDGFTAGQLPPKASIREIRINQNPFSAEYDKLGYGRIEILTKPGTDQYHGQFFLTGNTAGFNSRNPFEDLPAGTQPPGYYTTQFSANVGGPLSKKASFFFNIERRDITDLSVVSAQIVNPTTFAIEPFSDAVPNPKTRLNLSPRLDYQVTPTNTLSVRYQYWRNVETGDGVGTFNLASLATNSTNVENTLQVTDTQTVSPTIINETRFQYIRESNNGNPLTTTPEISVPGAFVSGGNTSGINTDTQNRYELQNITYITKGKHALKIGGRLRDTIDSSASNASFNGAYSFGSRVNPTVLGCNVPNPPTTCPTISGIDAYQITLMGLSQGLTIPAIQLQGGGASFYSLNYNTVGTAAARVNYFDGSLFAQDDYRFRPNITVSYGLRYETQNNLGDHADFAPRIGIAWGIDGNGKNKSAKTILRLGYGIFYDRFTENLVLQQQLQNGLIQQQYLIQSPNFFDPNVTVTPTSPLFPTTAQSTQAIYIQNPNLRTPYTMQTGVTLERQLSKFANLSVTYLNARGNHQFYSNFINAPAVLPGQPVPPPPSQIQYAYQSEGVFKQNQLIVNSSMRLPTPHGPIKDLSIFGYYTLNYANSDTSGANFFPSIPSDPSEDYGRASFDIRQRIFFGGTIGVPYGFRLSPFLIASSGIPFNITTGQDVYGDAQFNARPAFATCGAGAPAGVIQTAFGCFNALPQPGETPIPINYANGPGRFVFNLRLSKTFGFGQKKEAVASGGGPGGGTFGRGPGGPGGGGHGGGGGGGGPMFGGGGSSNNRYNLTFSVSARNVFNNVNYGTPIGNLSSPLFGEANSLAGQPYASSTANRRIDLQVQFTF
ncbi:MAG TPA: carboxypeptidase regulatory-like domain-containing protein [Candidatus Acidoferrum sp.]|nr:carboxypeptidase regulatory-like domain-containing protein [Candidatus Acidoferrum sp.]